MKKYFAPLGIKSVLQGEVVAVFATLNVVDHDGDVTLPGAFGDQPVVLEPWNHATTLPVGMGAIREEGNTAVLSGHFFLNTTAGNDHFQTIKSLGDMTQWSYTFSIIKSRLGQFQGKQVRFLEKLGVAGVGPVTRGAGIATRTVAIKSAGQRDLLADLADLERELLQSPEHVKAQLLELGGPDYVRQEAARIGATVATNYVQQLVSDGFSEPLARAYLDMQACSLHQQVTLQDPAFYEANPDMAWSRVSRYLNQLA
jgi:hypothetical protein